MMPLCLSQDGGDESRSGFSWWWAVRGVDDSAVVTAHRAQPLFYPSMDTPLVAFSLPLGRGPRRRVTCRLTPSFVDHRHREAGAPFPPTATPRCHYHFPPAAGAAAGVFCPAKPTRSLTRQSVTVRRTGTTLTGSPSSSRTCEIIGAHHFFFRFHLRSNNTIVERYLLTFTVTLTICAPPHQLSG